MQLSVKTQTILIYSSLFLFALVFACGFGSLVAYMVSLSVNNGKSASECGVIGDPNNCQNNCGCGWCSGMTLCQPLDDNFCINGSFDDEPSERCQEKYKEASIAAIVLISIAGSSLSISLCFVMVSGLYGPVVEEINTKEEQQEMNDFSKGAPV